VSFAKIGSVVEKFKSLGRKNSSPCRVKFCFTKFIFPSEKLLNRVKGKNLFMDDDLPKLLQRWGGRLRGVNRKNLILVIFIPIFALGLFFYSTPKKNVWAEKIVKKNLISAEIIDPLSRIGKGIVGDKEVPILEEEKEKEMNPFEIKIRSLVSGYPIEEMAPFIANQDREVAAFLVAIAKKESSWGKHTPKKNGIECYNFWGYRGKENPTESGYSCFETPEEAVSVVGARIQKLVDQGLNTPEKMLVWKCGNSCATHDPAGVRKWVSDVAQYIDKI